MGTDKKLKRVAILCGNFTRNLAFYKAGWNDGKFKLEGEFWFTVINNFLDMGVLEWDKLFGDKKGKHFWGKIVDNKDGFKISMIEELGLTPDDLESCMKKIRDYRNQFVAHLDAKETMHTPMLTGTAYSMINYYYSHVVEMSPDCNISITKALSNIRNYYDKCYEEAIIIYDQAMRVRIKDD